jgi:hypothetical protein
MLMGYFALLNELLVVSLTTLDVFVRSLFVFLVGTIVLTVMARTFHTVALAIHGFVIGYFLVAPLLWLVRDFLFRNWVGCSGYGRRTLRFPEGEPIGCDHNVAAFHVIFYLCFVLTWLCAIVCAFAALRWRKGLLTASAVCVAREATYLRPRNAQWLLQPYGPVFPQTVALWSHHGDVCRSLVRRSSSWVGSR